MSSPWCFSGPGSTFPSLPIPSNVPPMPPFEPSSHAPPLQGWANPTMVSSFLGMAMARPFASVEVAWMPIAVGGCVDETK